MPSKSQRERRRKERGSKRKRLFDVQVDEVSLVDKAAVPKSVYVIAKRDEVESETEETEVDQIESETVTESDSITKNDPPAEDPKSEPQEIELEKTDEQVAQALARAIQALRRRANVMPAEGLRLLAEMINFSQWFYGEQESIQTELSKCLTEKSEGIQIFKVEKDSNEESDSDTEPEDSDAIVPESGQLQDEAEPESVEKSETAESDPEPEPQQEAPEEESFLDCLAKALAEREEARKRDSDRESQDRLLAALERLGKQQEAVSTRFDALNQKMAQAKGQEV